VFFVRLALLLLNVAFLGLALALSLLALQHSEYTSALSNIYSRGGITVNLFEDPDTALLLVSLGLLLVSLQGLLGAWFSSRRVLLVYHISVLALLTALVYMAAMMFIYREDAHQMLHSYWQRLDSALMTDSDAPPSISQEEQDATATRMMFEMKRTGTLICVVGGLQVLALWCASFIMGWRYTFKHIGTGVNAIGFVFGVILLALSYVVATSTYDVPDALTARMEVEFTHTVGELSLEAVAFVELLRVDPEIMFQDHRNRLYFPPSPPKSPKELRSPTQSPTNTHSPTQAPTLTHSPTNTLAPTEFHQQKKPSKIPAIVTTSSPTQAPTTNVLATFSPTVETSPSTSSPTFSPNTVSPTHSPNSISPTRSPITSSPTSPPTAATPKASTAPTLSLRKLLSKTEPQSGQSFVGRKLSEIGDVIEVTNGPTNVPTTDTPTFSPTLLSSILEVGWKWPAQAVWVRDVWRDDVDERTEVVKFTISFSGLNATLLFHADEGSNTLSFTNHLIAHVATGANVQKQSVTAGELEIGGKHPIAGAWAAHLLAASGAISAIISATGIVGSSTGSRQALRLHLCATLMVMLMLLTASVLIISNADQTEKFMRHNWHHIQQDVVGSRLTVVEATQMVDNNMRMVGAWGAACLSLLTVSLLCSACTIWILPKPTRRRNRRRAGGKSSDEDKYDEDEDEELGGSGTSLLSSTKKRRKESKGAQETSEDRVVLEMQELQRLLERTTAAVGQASSHASQTNARDSRKKGRKYKKHYGSSDSEDSSSSDENQVELMIQKQFGRSGDNPQTQDPKVLSTIIDGIVYDARRKSHNQGKKSGKSRADDFPEASVSDLNAALTREGVQAALGMYFGQKGGEQDGSASVSDVNDNTGKDKSDENQVQSSELENENASKFTIEDPSSDEE